MCVPRDGREEPVGGIAPSAASRFLGQATFSASDESIAEVQRLGYAGWLDAEMAREPSGSRVGWLQSKGYFTSDNQFSMRGFEPCVWRKLIRAPDELRQRVTLALSEIFVHQPPARCPTAAGSRSSRGRRTSICSSGTPSAATASCSATSRAACRWEYT